MELKKLLLILCAIVVIIVFLQVILSFLGLMCKNMVDTGIEVTFT